MAATPTQILRINERLKLAATAANNVALAFAVAGFVGPVIATGGTVGAVMFLWLAYAAGCHIVGQAILGRLRA